MKDKIVLLSPSLRKGGAENQMVKLAVYLKAIGYDVTIMTLLPGNDFHEILINSKIDLYSGNFKSIKGFFIFFKAFKRLKPSLIISFMFAANIVGRILKIFYNTRLITSVRNNEIASICKFLYRFSYKLDDLSTFNSFYSYNKFIQQSLTNKQKSVVLNNAIEFDAEYVRYNYENKVPFSILSIAHFRKSKDYITLFNAIKVVKEEGYLVNLKVLGIIGNQTWPYQMIEDLEITENVELVGFSNQTNMYLEKADILVLSSFHEGTPNALLEAMSKKLPIIASDVPGNDYVVNQSESGYLFEVSNYMDLAAKIIQMIQIDSSQKKAFGEKGFEFIRREYEMNQVLGKWGTYIQKVLNNQLN